MRKSLLPLTIAFISSVALSSCSKNTGNTEEQNEKRAAEFLNFIGNSRYRLVDFYSDKPIDYITTDTEVRSETDLKAYIKPYLLDDENFFNDKNVVSVTQNANKFPGNNSPVLTGNYLVSYDASDVYFDFLDHNYAAARYKLSEFSPGKFVIYLDWPGGAKLYSRFESTN